MCGPPYCCPDPLIIGSEIALSIRSNFIGNSRRNWRRVREFEKNKTQKSQKISCARVSFYGMVDIYIYNNRGIVVLRFLLRKNSAAKIAILLKKFITCPEGIVFLLYFLRVATRELRDSFLPLSLPFLSNPVSSAVKFIETLREIGGFCRPYRGRRSFIRIVGATSFLPENGTCEREGGKGEEKGTEKSCASLNCRPLP